MRYVLPPPPYVPPEYMRCKRSEMPEPYRSQIDAWIESHTKFLEARVRAARQGLIFALAIGVPLITAAIVFALRK